jgi:hypothetical protein
MREESVNCPRKGARNEAASETRVSAMSNRGSRTLQQGKQCGCFHEASAASRLGFREHEPNLDEHRISRIHSLGSTTNGNTVASQNKTCNINEMLHGQMPQHADVNMNVCGDVAWSCPRICIDSTKEHHQLVSVGGDSEDLSPVLRLSLRKPRHWRWQLTASSSSPAIIVPTIRLVDEHGGLLLDTGGKCDSRTRRRVFSSVRVDSNGNGKEGPSGVSQGNRSGRCEVSDGTREVEHLTSVSAEGNKKVETARTVAPERDGSVEPRPEGTPRNRAHRRILDRQRNRGHSSTSSDSSPELGSGTRRKGRTLTGGAGLVTIVFSVSTA